MFSRKFAAIAISAGLLLTNAGCSFNPHPDSLQSYAPSDGSGSDTAITKGGALMKLRNFMYLTNGSTGVLLGTVINNTAKQQVVTINYLPADGQMQTNTLFVKPGEAVALGQEGLVEQPIAIDAKAGEAVKLSFGFSNNQVWQELNVPVLDGTLPEYREIVKGLAVVELPVIATESTK